MTRTRARCIPIFLLAAAGLLFLFLMIAAALPLGWLKGTAERQLSDRIGSLVRIGTLDRESLFSFRPVIRASDVHVGQAAWAGRGEMASIRLLRLRVALLPLLTGRFDAQLLMARGVRLTLVRAADGRVNWREGPKRVSGGGGSGLPVATVEDAVIRYSDAVQNRSATLTLAISPGAGLAARGAGSVDGAPVKLTIKGAPMISGQPWAFDAVIDGPALGIHAAGTMAGPLRTDDMRFHITARGDDLKRIDRIIEAGLFGTQPVKMSGDVRHADDRWTVEKLNGTIGQSQLVGRLTAHKTEGRTQLDADVRFPRLNFDDLASDSGNAKALALEQAQGLRLVPNTRINIHKIDKTNGRIAVRIDRVIGGRRPSSITSVSGVLTLEDRLLTVEPLRIGLSRGAITGKAVVDQHDGQPKPRVTLALDMVDSRISALAGGGDGRIDGRVDARVRLTGVGDTLREAVGTSDGTIGIAARFGSLPGKIAALIGFDIGKGLTGDDEEQAALRCAIVRLNVRNGRGTLDPLLVDTSISQTRGTGTITFPAEALAITLSGAPKGNGALRLPGTVSARGSIREPQIVVPESTKSVGNVLKALGRAITGKNAPPATNADCGRLINHAMAG
ncbi:MAG TPA: AsmA family protein [Sphingobium sp.]